MELFADIVGVTGTALLILAYFLLQAEKVKSDDYSYLYMNGIAPALMLFSLCYSFNLGSFILQIFWIAISIYGVWKKKRKEKI